MPIEDTVREAILPSKSTEPKSCQLCDQLKAECDQIVAELKTATNLVDHSQDLASEMELRSQETGKQISVHKQMIEEFRKRTVKVCPTILNNFPILNQPLLTIQLEETEAALADVKSQLASLQRTVYEEVKHTVDACAEEIRTLCRQLVALTAMTEQVKPLIPM